MGELIYLPDTYSSDMDSQPESELKDPKVGRPVSNFLREGLPSKICFLCYGKPLSTYEVSKTLYGSPMANVQKWMKKLEGRGYLKRVQRDVERQPGRRPKGDTGYQLVSTKIVAEMNRTLSQNTDGNLSFTKDEMEKLSRFFDSRDARNLMARITPTSLRDVKSWDLCSAFSLIFYAMASSMESRRRFKSGTLPNKGETPEGFMHLVNFGKVLQLTMGNRLSLLAKKLLWSTQPVSPEIYHTSILLGELRRG